MTFVVSGSGSPDPSSGELEDLRRLVRRRAARDLGSADCDDIVGTILVASVRAAKRDGTPIIAHALHAARNRPRYYTRTRQHNDRYVPMPIQADDDESASAEPDDQRHLSTLLDEGAREEDSTSQKVVIQDLLRRIPTDFAVAAVLHHGHGYTLAEVGARMGVSGETARRWAAAGCKELGQLWEEAEQE